MPEPPRAAAWRGVGPLERFRAPARGPESAPAPAAAVRPGRRPPGGRRAPGAPGSGGCGRCASSQRAAGRPRANRATTTKASVRRAALRRAPSSASGPAGGGRSAPRSPSGSRRGAPRPAPRRSARTSPRGDRARPAGDAPDRSWPRPCRPEVSRSSRCTMPGRPSAPPDSVVPRADQRVDQRVVPVARRRVHDQPGRLVDARRGARPRRRR